MFFLILENIGTQEIILIGLVALIFLGPRRMPEIARKIGKVMADFRNTTSEFKETWQREVNFEEEKKALDFRNIEVEQVPLIEPVIDVKPVEGPTEPAISEIDPARFEIPETKKNKSKKPRLRA